MSVDPIEKAIGTFGKYQIWIFILITIGRYPAEFQLTNVVFLLPTVDYTCLDDPSTNLTNTCPCQNPDYDKSTIVSSVTTEWNLICDRSSLASLAQSMLQVGILIGSIIYGYISDRFGRKKAVVLALTMEALTVAGSAIISDFWVFMFFRFLIGTALGGTVLCCYVIIIELSGKSFLPYLTGLIELSFMTGYLFMPMIAFFVRDWRYLQLVTSVPWLIVVVFYWIIPESPRWLITVGKKEEAIRVLTFIAQKNGLPTGNIESIVYKVELEENNVSQTRGSYLDLFRTPKIRMYSLLSAMVWLCISHVFYGVNQYIGRLQGNLYLNVILSASAFAPGLVLCVVCVVYLRRKVAVICNFLVVAVSLLLFICIPSNQTELNLFFAIIGEISAYNAWVQIYLTCSEVFPTVIRNSALGFVSMFARMGGFVAPFVVNIGVEWISILIFSALALLSAILSSFLPETKNITLLNTIEQAENRKPAKAPIQL